MSREGQLAKNTLIISFGTILPKIINVVTLPIITAYLTKAELGKYDLITTLVALILPIATLQIHSAAFRFLIDCRDDKNKAACVIVTMLVFVVITSIVGIGITVMFLPGFETEILIWMSLYFFVDILFIALQQIARGLSLNYLYSISTIINASVNLIAVFLMLCIFSQRLKGVLISLTVALFVGCVFLFCKLRVWDYIFGGKFEVNTLKEMISYSWPMIPNNISGWVLRLSDRLVIIAFLGVEANAVYAVANKIPNLISTFQTTFTYAWQENASIATKDDDSEEYYSKIFESVYNILIGIMASLIAMTPIMFELLIRGDYDEAYGQMPILFMGMLFSSVSSMLGGIYIAHKKTKSVGISTFFAAIIHLIVVIIAIPYIGITAGSIATVVSFAILSVYRMINVKKFQKVNFNYYKIIFWLVILLIMCLICQKRTMLCYILNFIIAFITVIVTNVKNIKAVINKIIKNN